MKRLVIPILTLLLLSPTLLHGQTLASGEALYNEGKYEEAREVFERLIRRSPSDAFTNHWYGAALYQTGDLEKAQKHLEFGVKRKVINSYLYLGMLNYDQYNFGKAIGYWEEYKAFLEKKKKETHLADSLLQKGRMGERMLGGVEMVQIIDSVVVDKAHLLEQYKLSAQSGTLHNSRQFFDNSSLKGTLYQRERGDRVVYSMPDSMGKMNLASRSLLLDDKWSEPHLLEGRVNTSANEAYPFLLSDGVTLYFASDNLEESLGGYDLFVTRQNLNSGLYLMPENLGMPFNSPANDYMMAIDEYNNVGWFASDRNQKEGDVIIYLFIPNTSKQIYRGEDDNLARSLARIDNIKLTWKNPEGYASLLEKIYHPKVQDKVMAEFYFPINNKMIYTSMSNFESTEARNLFVKAVDTRKEIASLKQQLEQLRNRYQQQATENGKTQILQLEEQLRLLYPLPTELENRARNTEIAHLQNQ